LPAAAAIIVGSSFLLKKISNNPIHVYFLAALLRFDGIFALRPKKNKPANASSPA
jgi:hypothetical protein